MKRATDPIITRTTSHLSVSVTIRHEGGSHQTFTFRLALEDIRDRDVAELLQALHDETARRLKARWPSQDDTPLF